MRSAVVHVFLEFNAIDGSSLRRMQSLSAWILGLVGLGLCRSQEVVDPSKTEVWGPGLTPDEIVLPARYFYIHANTNNGTRHTLSPGEVFLVTLVGRTTHGDCHAWIQVLDRYDGSFIVRYKLFRTCWDVVINVQYAGRHVAMSPYVVKGAVYPEDCSCPTSDLQTYMQKLGCRNYSQIESDLSPFKNVDVDRVLEEAIVRFNHSGTYSICNYVIKSNRVYRRCYGRYVGFSMFMDAMLLSLVRKTNFPDTEFIVNLGDWPLAKTNSKPIPLFSWCGSNETLDIVMPTYDITEASLECMGRVTLDMLSVQSNGHRLPWEEKKKMAFFRGRDSCRERLDLIDLGRAHPELLNVSITNFFFFRDLEEEYGPKQSPVSLFDFFDYKYQLNIDGTVASYRFPYLLAGNSVVFKQESPYYEHYYSELVPWKHFIPVQRDLSDLIQKLRWAISHDEEARKIGQAGQEYACKHLMPVDIFCYHASLIHQWSQLVKSSVKVREGMEHVTPKKRDPKLGPCICDSASSHDEL